MDQRLLAAMRAGNPLRKFFWRAWMPDGLIIDKFDNRGFEHHVHEIAANGVPLKLAWVTFSEERSKRCWDRNIPAIHSCKRIEDERAVATLENADMAEKRQILPTATGRGVVVPTGRNLKRDAGGPFYALVAYHLNHPDKVVTVDWQGHASEHAGAGAFAVVRDDMVLGKDRLTKEYELRG